MILSGSDPSFPLLEIPVVEISAVEVEGAQVIALKVDFPNDQMFRLLRGRLCLSEILADRCFLIVSMPLLSIQNQFIGIEKLRNLAALTEAGKRWQSAFPDDSFGLLFRGVISHAPFFPVPRIRGSACRSFYPAECQTKIFWNYYFLKKVFFTMTVGEVTRLLITAPLIIPFRTQYAPRIDKQKQTVINKLPKTIKLFCQDSGARLKPDKFESSLYIF